MDKEPASEALFDGHVTHVFTKKYMLRGHYKHPTSAFPVKPLLHLQSDFCVDFAIELLLAGHTIQALLPTNSLYVFGAQFVQDKPSVPVVPGLHLQSDALSEPAEACASEWHGVHA